MRDRKSIEDNLKTLRTNGVIYPKELRYELILEALLDIRELLMVKERFNKILREFMAYDPSKSFKKKKEK